MTREEVKRAIEHDVYRAKCRGLSQKQIEYFIQNSKHLNALMTYVMLIRKLKMPYKEAAAAADAEYSSEYYPEEFIPEIRKEILEDLEAEEYDITVFEETQREYEKDGKRSRPIQELWKELDLETENDVTEEIDWGNPVGKKFCNSLH